MTAFQVPGHLSDHADVPNSQLRIMDEFVNLPHIPDDDGDMHRPAPLPGQHFNPRPDFTNNMLAQMDPSLATAANLAQQGVIIRTWYIHHETFLRNDRPRLVHLAPDQTQWIHQIVNAWADLVDVTVPKAFTLPTPMPFRGQADQFVALDVILSQGLHQPRFSGLVSVHFMDDFDGLQTFIVAASFPPWVSGYHIVNAAEVHQFCAPISGRACNIYHGWNTIPVDTNPQHHMRPGNSFMIQIPRDPQLEVGNSQAASSTQAAVQVLSMPGGTNEDHFDAGPDGDDQGDGGPGESPSSDPPTGNVDAHGPLFNCHFYRLRHPPLHIFLNNAAGVPMLQELARRMGVVPASLLQAHPVRAMMVGDQVADFSFVLQSINDLPAASSDALIILDVEVHFTPVPGELNPLPAAARRVVRVLLHVSREAVLGIAGVQHYCRLQQDRCLVFLNGRGWPILRPGPLTMRHGNYLRVIVPPPIDGTNTLQAVHLAEDRLQRALAPVGMPPFSPAPAPVPAPSGFSDQHPPAPPPRTSPSTLDTRWFHSLQDIFHEEALVEFEEEGPILYVWTWFINHETYTHCPYAKVVRLDEISNLWLQDLYAPWNALLQEDVPTSIAVVHARPPQDTFRIDAIHIMIEQHPCEARVAGVLSAVFHGPRDDRLLQVGKSIPRWICTEDVIDLLEINHVCETQRCRANVGGIPMQQFIRHDLPSAVSIELHIKPVHCEGDDRAASSADQYVPRTVLPVSANSLMQTVRRWGRTRTQENTVEPIVPGDHLADAHLACSSTVPAPLPIPVQAPLVEGPIPIPWPTQWRTLPEVWAFFFGQNALHFPGGIAAEVWYSDHVRMPWSEAGRVVYLPPDFSAWIPRILECWNDWLLQDVGYELFVVTPTPLGGENPVHIHVILLQQPHPDRFSCILTVMDKFTDPWVPSHVSLTLPRVIDHWVLLQQAVVEFQCPPLDLTTSCRSSFGHTDLTAGNLFPVSHALCFTVVVEELTDRQQPGDVDLPTDMALGATDDAVGFLQTRLKLPAQSSTSLLESTTSVSTSLVEDTHADLESTQMVHQTAVLWHTLESFYSALVPPETVSSGAAPLALATSQVTISLCASLVPNGDPDRPAFHDDRSTLVWLHDDNWAATCTLKEQIPLLPLPDGMHVPLETYDALLHAAAVPPRAEAQWEIYVDGATSSTSAAWSVVIIQVVDQGTMFHGRLSGPVVTNSDSALWIGATSLENIAAEFQAFVVALLIVHSQQLPGKILIRPDLSLSRAIAQFECGTTSNVVLANVMRLFSYWLGDKLSVAEVRGHRHHPWNELAGRLAGFALDQPTPAELATVLAPLHALALEKFDSHWAWMQNCPRSLLHAFPPLCDGQVMQFPLSLRRSGQPTETPLRLQAPSSSMARIDFKVVTDNVLALETTSDAREVGRRVGVRTQRLDAQWHAQNIHLIGLQEARTPAGVFQSEHYKIWSSGHVGPGAARFGCELWCHRSLPLARSESGRNIHLDDFQVIVSHADPRRLFVRFEYPGFAFAVVVLHAPCLAKTEGSGHRPIEDIQIWWEETSGLIAKNVNTDLAWYLVDANAPLATEHTELCGMHGAEPMNPQGRIFEAFLHEHQLTVPSTFHDFHYGPTSTWTHSSGKKLRRDYILVSSAAVPLIRSTQVLTDHDTMFEHEDHLPLCLAVAGDLSIAEGPPDRIRWDFDRLRDPQIVEDFQAALATLPLPTWDINVDEHCRLYESNVLQLARQFFESHGRKRRRPQLTATTLANIQFKRHILDCGRAWGLMHDEDYKIELRAIEKVVKAQVYADLQVHYDQILVDMQQAGELGDLRVVHQRLARLGSKKPKRATVVRPLPALRQADGTLATSFSEQQQLWMRQFSEIEAGTQVHWQELQRLDRPGLRPPLDIHQQALFPSPWVLQNLLRKLKRGKVPGLNGITTEILKAGAGPLCTQLCALTTKAVAHCKEPLEWKGGLLVPLSKGKADAADPLGYRSIFISNFTAKLYHMALRSHLVTVWEHGISSLQLGGRRRMGADLAHHFLQAHGHWATSAKKPYAHLFFDIKSAFYSVLR